MEDIRSGLLEDGGDFDLIIFAATLELFPIGEEGPCHLCLFSHERAASDTYHRHALLTARRG